MLVRAYICVTGKYFFIEACGDNSPSQLPGMAIIIVHIPIIVVFRRINVISIEEFLITKILSHLTF